MGRVAILCVMVAACCFIIFAAEATTIRMHNHCGSTVCFRYWIPGPRRRDCAEEGADGTWTVLANSSWQGATMWTIRNTGCSGQACNTGPPSGLTQFEITVAGGGGNDHYDVSKIAGYNGDMTVVPTNGSCPTAKCTSANSGPCYYVGGPNETKACPTGSTDYDVYMC